MLGVEIVNPWWTTRRLLLLANTKTVAAGPQVGPNERGATLSERTAVCVYLAAVAPLPMATCGVFIPPEEMRGKSAGDSAARMHSNLADPANVSSPATGVHSCPRL